jgi:adenosylcobinamide kinase / adenosylcobinamide-phosphate guanylyltransferase
MSLVLLLGGARSGKSALAVELAKASGAPVVFVATGEAGDDEMRGRIERHRRERPDVWTTVEEPRHLAAALAAVPDEACVVVDCLSFWVANVFEGSHVEAEAAEAARRAATRAGRTIAVSNEVGMGLVPDNPVGREYRDVLGRVNSLWAREAAEAYLIVAGRALRLEEPPRA